MTSSAPSAPIAVSEFSRFVQERLQKLDWILHDCSSQHPRIYEQAFTPEERGQHPFDPQVSLVSLWRDCHPEANHFSALVELGRRGGVIEQSTYEFLVREISAVYPGENLFSGAVASGEMSASAPQTRRSSEVPEWNRSEGELRYQGAVVRTFQSITRAKRCVWILDEFQAQGWPQRIQISQETHLRDPHLKKTVQSLNAKLDRITFERLPSQEICWSLLPEQAHSPQASRPS